jgi:hypothetical protein
MPRVELETNFKIDWPIRQGDVLGFWDWNSRAPLSRFGVVITADCDIANGRSDQELVYLRTISQADYIDIFWSRSKLDKACDKAFQDLVPLINRLRSIIDREAKGLSRQDVEQWIVSASADEICDAIGVEDPGEQLKLRKNLERTVGIAQLVAAPAGTACLERLASWGRKGLSEVIEQATKDLTSLRDELFFLSSIADPAQQSGYYVLLDQIGAVRHDQITNSVSELKQGNKTVYRFGRLAPTYKYALAQRFAYLFQRIGLPDDHAERHRRALSSMNSPREGAV